MAVVVCTVVVLAAAAFVACCNTAVAVAAAAVGVDSAPVVPDRGPQRPVVKSAGQDSKGSLCLQGFSVAAADTGRAEVAVVVAAVPVVY